MRMKPGVKRSVFSSQCNGDSLPGILESLLKIILVAHYLILAIFSSDAFQNAAALLLNCYPGALVDGTLQCNETVLGCSLQELEQILD